jgi:hypothetical protein
MEHLLKSILTVCWLLFFCHGKAQVTYTTVAPGNWTNPAIWAGGVVPAAIAGDTIRIAHAVRMDTTLSALESKLIVQGNTALTIDTLRYLYIGDTLVLHGRLVMKGMYDVAVIMGMPGSCISIESGGLISNGGQIHSLDTMLVRQGGTFDDQGQVEVLKSFNNAGFYDNDDLILKGPGINTGRFDNTGIVEFSGGTFSLEAGSYYLSGGSFNVALGSLLTNNTIIDSTSSINVWGIFSNKGSANQATIRVYQDGNFTNASTARLLSSTLFLQGIAQNFGDINTLTARISSGGLLENQLGGEIAIASIIDTGRLFNQSRIISSSITVAAGGQFDNTTTGLVTPANNSQLTVAGNSVNSGKIEAQLFVTAGGLLTNQSRAVYNFGGNVASIDGTFTRQANDTLQNLATVQGTGVVNGEFMPVTLFPATSSLPGIFTINGNYALPNSSSSLQVNIAGTTPGQQYDRVVVNGTATLTGSRLHHAINFTPPTTTQFTILRSTTLVGTFVGTTPALPTGWTVAYNTPATGDVTLLYTSPIPLKLLGFGGSVLNSQTIALNWQTTNENNVDRFELECGQDGSRFQMVQVVTARNTDGPNQYTFNHLQPGPLHFYRLKTVDRDGQYTYSGIIRFARGQQPVLLLYPSPVKDILTVSLPAAGPAWLRIADFAGRVLIRQRLMNTVETISVSQLPTGSYWIGIEQGGKTTTGKLLKQ